MKYDFDSATDRRGTNSLKWDEADGALPMWVADMEFVAAPPIRRAIERRAAHGIFGYTVVPDEWYDAYIGWWKNRHGLAINKDSLIFCTGIVPAISSLVRKLTTPAEKVLLQTPVYNIFFNSIVNNGRNVIESPLAYKNGSYTIDFEDLEQKLSDPQTTLMILCNPHNPVGKIWSSDELQKIGELCSKHGVTVISDEIHCDLTTPGKGYVPFASVSPLCADISVTCIAPTKTFNIAGCQTAAVFSDNPMLRHKAWRALNTDEVAEPNAFAIDAAVAAFNECGDWLDELREYIFAGKQTVTDFIKAELPYIHVVDSEATYLMWLDFSSITDDADALAEFIKKNAGVYLAGGGQYGDCGKTFMRLNVACQRSMLNEALARLKKGVELYLQTK